MTYTLKNVMHLNWILESRLSKMDIFFFVSFYNNIIFFFDSYMYGKGPCLHIGTNSFWIHIYILKSSFITLNLLHKNYITHNLKTRCHVTYRIWKELRLKYTIHFASLPRLVHERILGILAAQSGPNGQVSCLHSFNIFWPMGPSYTLN